MKIDIKKSVDLFKTLGLTEHTLYKIRVKTTSANVEHEAYLFTGFENGSYCKIYNNTYDHPIDMMEVYSMKIIKKLSTLK
jgi:hypothetical protein